MYKKKAKSLEVCHFFATFALKTHLYKVKSTKLFYCNMDKKLPNKLGLAVGFIISFILGALIMWQFLEIKHKNEEIAFLKEEISREQTDRFKDILKFGQWKLQVEELAKENGWVLPEMSDSLVFKVASAIAEEHISTVIEDDSVRVIDKSIITHFE